MQTIKSDCAHLIIQLPPLSLLSTTQDLILNYSGILKVFFLSEGQTGKKNTSSILIY